ncbi:hypothetical protein [Nocardia sp. CDC160]|uniref:hypothetical protein n=1 Tax=Nocardia sp. CDC160 TaxID=3112166 RepID=UPI002DB8EB1B|nr:hypothetical protein [Nocardia sp. CDC160]MEC3918909.1 hypothetical protein [Nocardia sp. CDC160]
MRAQAIALTYIDPDVSGRALAWDMAQCRRLARTLGYTLLTPSELPALGLLALVRQTHVDAVLVPTPEHVSPHIVSLLAELVDIESVRPRRSITRTRARQA